MLAGVGAGVAVCEIAHLIIIKYLAINEIENAIDTMFVV